MELELPFSLWLIQTAPDDVSILRLISASRLFCSDIFFFFLAIWPSMKPLPYPSSSFSLHVTDIFFFPRLLGGFNAEPTLGFRGLGSLT